MPPTAFLMKYLRNHRPADHPLCGLGDWLTAQLGILAKREKETGEYPTRAAEDVYRNAGQVIARLRQWSGAAVGVPPKRTSGAGTAAALTSLRDWCIAAGEESGSGYGNGADDSTVEASLAQAAGWLKMDRRALKRSIEDEAITAVRHTARKWVFDRAQIERMRGSRR